MKRYKTLVLSRRDVEGVVDMKKAIPAVESVFRSLGMGKVTMPPKIYIHLPKYEGDFRAMPSFVEDLDACAIKWVNVHPRNSRFGLPAVMAVIILSDPKNGFPLCIMDGTYITRLRTGAAGGVAAKYLARRNSGRIGLVGCGAQARAQLSALVELFDIEEVKLWGYKSSCAEDFIRDMKKPRRELKAVNTVKECVEDCDIVVTTTPSRKPLVKLKWLKEGVHINAIGADAKGKEELEPAILKKAKVVVDAWEQAAHSGEINVPVSKGVMSRKDIYADIGQIVTRKKAGRTDEKEITVFDSTGLAIQDAALAALVYKKTVKSGCGRRIELV